MPALAPLRVVGPPPKAPLYSLVSTPETLVEQSDPHWRGGVSVDSYPVETPVRHYPCSTGTARVKPEGEEPPTPEFPSFTVLIPITCSGMGIGDTTGAELLRRRVREAFVARESFGVEQQLILGDPAEAGDPHVADSDLVKPNGNTMVSPREAVAILEREIGETAQQGMLHIPPDIYAAMPADYFVVDGRTTRTKRGNTVIIGNGYIGATPDDYDPGNLSADQGWVWATGLVRATRDPDVTVPLFPDVFNEETNQLTFRAERNYVVYWDTALQVGVPVDRSLTP